MQQNKQPMNRRDFLRFVGLGAATVAASGSVSALEDLRRIAQRNDLEAFETTDELVAEIERRIRSHFEGREMALDFRRINENGGTDFVIQINQDKLYPVASAFKAFAILYYFMYVPFEDWQFDPESDVYRVAVFSNNTLTGNLITSVRDYAPGNGNDIEKFNNFIIDFLGMEEGIYTWNWLNTTTNGVLDDRFRPGGERMVEVYERREFIGNASTAADLAKGWAFIANAEQHPKWGNEQFRSAILATRELLSIPANSYRSPLERVVYGGYTGKDGTLQVGDISLGRVINDAGYIRVDGVKYVIGFMSTAEGEVVTDPALQEVVDSIRIYQDYHNPLRRITIEGTSYPVVMGQFNHGFVRANDIELYLEPDALGAKVANPARRSSTWGTPYVMRGALLRFEPVNEHWGKLVKDDPQDNFFTYTDWTYAFQQANWNEWNLETRPDIYVPIDKLKLIAPTQAEPIDFVTDIDQETDKWMLLHIPRRQLTIFEGATAILKTPVVLNTLATPRGRFYINRVMMTRNMPTYPGVPYTNFLHNGGDMHQIGYAIHGAPWHLWEQTVNEWETIRRFSAGCINIPGWSWQITPNYEMPVDEFIFRWIGGFPDLGGSTSYFKRERVHCMAFINPYEEIGQYSIFSFMRQQGVTWGDVIRAWEEKPLDAVPSFFENPNNNEGVNILNLGAALGDR